MNTRGVYMERARRPEDALDDDALDLAVEETVAEHGGDSREAIRALLREDRLSRGARDRALDLISFGYARGKVGDIQ